MPDVPALHPLPEWLQKLLGDNPVIDVDGIKNSGDVVAFCRTEGKPGGGNVVTHDNVGFEFLDLLLDLL